MTTDQADVETASDTSEATSDTYSAVEAGRVLGISERRVRQLAGDGTLPPATADGPLRLWQADVHAERARRRDAAKAAQRNVAAEPGHGRPDLRPPSAPVDVEALVDTLVRRVLPLALEPAQRAEADAKAAYVEERALRQAAEARVSDLAARLAVAEDRLSARGETHTRPDDAAPAGRDDVGDQAEDEPRRRGWWRRQGV